MINGLLRASTGPTPLLSVKTVRAPVNVNTMPLWTTVNKGLRQGALNGLDSGVKLVLIVLVTLNIG